MYDFALVFSLHHAHTRTLAMAITREQIAGTPRRSPRSSTWFPRSSSEARVSELHKRTLTELAAGLRARKFSSVVVVRAFLGRIESRQGTLNAFVSVTSEQALAEAAGAD